MTALGQTRKGQLVHVVSAFPLEAEIPPRLGSVGLGPGAEVSEPTDDGGSQLQSERCRRSAVGHRGKR